MKILSGISLFLAFFIAISSSNTEARQPEQSQPTQFGYYDHYPYTAEAPPPHPGHYPSAPYEQEPVKQPTTAPALSPVFLVPPGTREELNISLSNKTEIEQQYIQSFYKRGERDGDILLATIDRLRSSVIELNLTVSELQRISDESTIQPISVKEFLDKVRAFRQEANIFIEDINSLEHFPTLRDDMTYDPASRVDMQPLSHHFQITLERLNAQVEDLHFTIALPNGMFHHQLGINSEQLKGMSLYTAEQMSDMKRNIMILRAMRTQDKHAIDEGINRFSKNAIETFIDTFGKSERYRTSSDLMGKDRAKEMLLDAFWARSFIRATYGIQIGCIPVEYDKRIFNLDYYLNDMTVGAAPIYDQNKLMHYANLAQEAMVTIGNSTSKKWNSVNAWLTWVSGKTNEMDTKLFMIALIKKDLDEELSLSRSGGLRMIRDDYRQHYLGSEIGRALYKAKARQVFSSPNDLDDNDIESDIAVVEAGTLKGSIAMCINALENQENRLYEARQLQSVIDEMAKGNVFSERRKRRQLFE